MIGVLLRVKLKKLYVRAACEACRELNEVHTLATDFLRMLREKDVNTLGRWLESVKASSDGWLWDQSMTGTR